MSMLPVCVMMYMGLAGAVGPVFLKLAQDVPEWGLAKLVYLGVFVFFYGTGFIGMLWVVKHAPLNVIVPVWYATLLVLAAVLAWVMLGERLSLAGLAAYGLIVAGLVLRLWEAVSRG